MEKWKVLELDTRYSISNLGNVVSRVYGTEKSIHPVIDNRGYYYVRIKIGYSTSKLYRFYEV